MAASFQKKIVEILNKKLIFTLDYLKEKNIRMVLDKKSMLLADENLDITQDIVKLLNGKLKSIKLN